MLWPPKIAHTDEIVLISDLQQTGQSNILSISSLHVYIRVFNFDSTLFVIAAERVSALLSVYCDLQEARWCPIDSPSSKKRTFLSLSLSLLPPYHVCTRLNFALNLCSVAQKYASLRATVTTSSFPRFILSS